MIYGANGYTGRLAARVAKARGFAPILAGRNAEHIEVFARELGFEARIFDLADPEVVARNLNGVAVVLHCAGPFSATSRPMLAGCLRAKTHYLDITGEIAVFEDIFSRADEIKRGGIVAIPGVGFDVVPTDCLAAMLKRALPSATHLKLAFRARHGKLSPGTAKTVIEGLPEGGKIRKEGKIVSVPSAYKVEIIRFTADEPSTAVTIPWGDVSTAFHSTGIPNIEVFVAASQNQIASMKVAGLLRWVFALRPVQAFLKTRADSTVRGPSDEERARDEMLLFGEVSDDGGNKVARRLRTAEGYTFTAESGVIAASKMLAGKLAPGAYTPSLAFGADYVLQFEGSRVSRVEE